MTEWKAYPQHSRYLVSDDGRVLSTFTGRELSQKTHYRNGYREVNLKSLGMRLVHRMVLETFVGPPSHGAQGCHWNGDKSDNRLANLRWDSARGNSADTRRHGRLRFGEFHPQARLSDAEAVALRFLVRAGIMTEAQAALSFPISASGAHLIAAGKSRTTRTPMPDEDGELAVLSTCSRACREAKGLPERQPGLVLR